MPRFHKYKLLLDEGFPLRSYFPRLNSTHTLKHFSKDLKKSGLTDREVFSITIKLKMLVITYNYKDFIEFVKDQKSTGVIGISANLPLEQIDKKLSALLFSSSPKDLFGTHLYLSGETE